jgi:ubiquinone/menaquinone biosynthesis C-methylase UbiE
MSDSWDNDWNKIYQEQGFRAKYPDEYVVRFIAGNFFKLSLEQRKKVKVLDLGCGPGRHVVFLAKEGFSANGIEGAPSAIKLCQDKINEEKLEAIATVGDFVKLPYPDDHFDAIIDCCSIQHNQMTAVKQIFQEIKRTLKPKGKFFSMVRTDKDYAFGLGRELERGTFTDYTEFDLNHVGHIHFFSDEEIMELFSMFGDFSYEYCERTFDERKKAIRHWVITAEK